MKIGDLVKFTGTWGTAVAIDNAPQIGVVIETWTVRRILRQVDVLWDNGDIRQAMASQVKVINANR
jgi:hypothetical protein